MAIGKTLRKSKLRCKKTRRQQFKAGNGEKVKCCMCERIVNKNNILIPRKCLTKHGIEFVKNVGGIL